MYFDNPEPDLQYEQEIVIVEREPLMVQKAFRKGISHGYDNEGYNDEFSSEKTKNVNNLLYP